MMRIRFAWWTVFTILFSLIAFGDAQAAGISTRVSVGSSGNQGISGSNYASISADGRYVAFRSHASNRIEKARLVRRGKWNSAVRVALFSPFLDGRH